MFVKNFVKLSAAVHELSCWERKFATMPKTIRPALPRSIYCSK